MSAAILAAAVMAGCPDSSAPPSATGTATPPPRQPLSGLSENPTSLAGRSAATGRNAVRQAEQRDDQAMGLATEISGESVAVEVAGLQFHAPTAWESQKPASTMQAAAFRVLADAGAEGEGKIVFFTFGPGQGGDAESNIQRWRNMVIGPDGGASDADAKKRKVAGYDVTMVSMEGTYKEGVPGGPTTDRPGYGFRGAIVEGGPKGSIFIRFTGPAEIVNANEAAWRTMVLGLKRP